MTRTITFLAVGVLLLGASACEKDAISIEAPVVKTEFTLQQRLNLLSPPLVMFQYAYVDLEKGEESGWIVDRQGSVKAYHHAFLGEGEKMADNVKLDNLEMQDLYARATEPLAQIDLEELLVHAHQGAGLSHKFLTAKEVDESSSWVAAFYGYTQQFDVNTQGYSGRGCYGPHNYIASTSNTSTDQITRNVINISGYLNRYETSVYAIDLYEWLWKLQQEL